MTGPRPNYETWQSMSLLYCVGLPVDTRQTIHTQAGGKIQDYDDAVYLSGSCTSA
jgi:hypothetical protein